MAQTSASSIDPAWEEIMRLKATDGHSVLDFRKADDDGQVLVRFRSSSGSSPAYEAKFTTDYGALKAALSFLGSEDLEGSRE